MLVKQAGRSLRLSWATRVVSRSRGEERAEEKIAPKLETQQQGFSFTSVFFFLFGLMKLATCGLKASECPGEGRAGDFSFGMIR